MSNRARRAFKRERLAGTEWELPEDDDLDLSLVDEAIEGELEVGARPGAYAIGEPGQAPDDWEPVDSNWAQTRLRNAARSGMFRTIVAAGTISSSKTFGIAMIINELCMEYPETEVLIIRPKREQLMDSTIPDFLASLPPSRIKKFNRSRLYIDVYVGQYVSRIKFRQANEQTDKGFLWLKGNKPDIIFVDECDGVSKEFIGMAMSRVGIQRKRSRADIPICPPLTFLACNPNIAWPKEYYSLAVHQPEKLAEDRIYFQKFTIEDNRKFITEEKRAAWRKQFTPAMYKRFVEGSWDAMADREQLFLYEYMDKCSVRGPNGTTRPLIQPPVDDYSNTVPFPYFIGVDPARYGPDRCAFLIMHGPNLHRLEFFDQSSITEIEQRTVELMAEYKVTPDHVTVDVTGLGAGVVDNLAERRIYVNAFAGAEAPDLNYTNFTFKFGNKRAQVFWQVMQWMRDGKLGGFDSLGWHQDVQLDETLRSDLASIHYSYDPKGKAMWIEGKEEIKKRLGRSPDFADVLCMACYSMFKDANAMGLEIIF